MSNSRRSRYASPSCSPYPGGKALSRSRSRSRSEDLSDVENPGNNLYVTGLSSRVTKRELGKHFNAEGKVTDVHLVVDPWTRESRGFGFITMASVEDADRCIKYLDGSVLEGRVITVEKARRRRGRTPTPGRYLGLRTVSDGGRRRSPSYSPYYRRYSSPGYASESDRSYSPSNYRRRHRSRSYSPYYRRHGSCSYSPHYRRQRSRSLSRSRSPYYSRYSRSPAMRRRQRSYSRDSRRSSYSSASDYYNSRHYRSVSRSLSPRRRYSGRRSYSRSVSPYAVRGRSYSRSVTPDGDWRRSSRSYARSYSRSDKKVSKGRRSCSYSRCVPATKRRSKSRHSRESYSHSRSSSGGSSAASRSVSASPVRSS